MIDTTSKKLFTSSHAWLPYITIPKLNDIKRLLYPLLAMAAEAQPTVRLPRCSSKRPRLQLERMADMHDELVIIEYFLPSVRTPTLMDRSCRVIAVNQAKFHALKWLDAHAPQCEDARVVVKADSTGSVFIRMVLPLATLAAKDQKALTDAKGSLNLISFNCRSTSTGAAFGSKDCRRVARILCEFCDGRLYLSEHHPDRLMLLNEIAARLLKLEPQDKLPPLSFHVDKIWLERARADLIL